MHGLLFTSFKEVITIQKHRHGKITWSCGEADEFTALLFLSLTWICIDLYVRGNSKSTLMKNLSFLPGWDFNIVVNLTSTTSLLPSLALHLTTGKLEFPPILKPKNYSPGLWREKYLIRTTCYDGKYVFLVLKGVEANKI